jgi:hypothetical protein
LQPLLPYVAPELIAGFGNMSSVGPAADVFSLATIVYELLSGGQQLLPVRNALHEYKPQVAELARVGGGITGDKLASMPPQLQGALLLHPEQGVTQLTQRQLVSFGSVCLVLRLLNGYKCFAARLHG